MSSCWLELKRYYTNSRFQQLDDSKLRSYICTSCPKNLSNRNKSPQKNPKFKSILLPSPDPQRSKGLKNEYQTPFREMQITHMKVIVPFQVMLD